MSSSKKTAVPAVALLLFNRPELTQRVVDEVVAAHPSAVYLIADGPRPDHPEDVALCRDVRRIATEAPWTGVVHTDFAETNLGLKRRVSSGLDVVFQKEERAIILEDDCLPDSSFFPFATELLERYQNDERVGMISGNNFLWGAEVTPDSYFFSSDVRIWGWATWRRVWNPFFRSDLEAEWADSEVQGLVRVLPSPFRRRAMMLAAGNLDSLDTWDVQFVLHCLKRRYLNPTPSQNLVQNIGFGAQSTHTAFQDFSAEVPRGKLDFPLIHPSAVSVAPNLATIESLANLRRWVAFPLSHPIDFVARVARFVLGKLR